MFVKDKHSAEKNAASVKMLELQYLHIQVQEKKKPLRKHSIRICSHLSTSREITFLIKKDYRLKKCLIFKFNNNKI